jgi:tetratricopeptide (TPR) repeat protein
LLLGQNQTEAAADQFTQILGKDPENSRAHLGMARLAHQRGDLAKSLQHLSYPLEDKRTQKAAHLLLAQVQQERKDSDAADRAMRKARKLATDAPWPDPFEEEMASFQTGLKGALARAKHLLREERLADAVTLLKDTAQEYPMSDTVLTLLGKAYNEQKDFPAAEAALGKALEIAPNSTDALFRLGVTFLAQDRAREAAAKFRRAIDLQPGFGTAYFNLGHCLLKEGDRPGAIAAFRSTIQAMPEFAPAHRLLGNQLAENGQHAEAIVQFQEALKLDPGDQKTRDLLELAVKRKPS